MTRIVNTLKTAALSFNGILLAELSSPLLDTLTTPDTLYLPSIERFEIVDGNLDIDLPSTQEQGVSYKIGFYKVSTRFNYWFEDGTPYLNPGTHLWTDGQYYTGYSHTPTSELLQRQTQEILDKVWEIETLIPVATEVELSELLPSGITSDTLAEGAAFVADILVKKHSNSLARSVLNFRGNYISTEFYLERDVVFYAGSSWRMIRQDPVLGVAPTFGSPVWDAIAVKGDPGGTGGASLPFSEGWQNNFNAPSLHDLWVEFNNRATIADLNSRAPKDNPAFAGAATYTTQALGGGQASSPTKTRLATLEYAFNEAREQLRKQLIGIIFETSTANPPQFTVRANGQTLLRETYPELWAIATGNPAYGQGDGSTTFVVPNRINPSASTYFVLWAGV